MTDIRFIKKENQWQESTTIYWFEVSNCPYLTETSVIGLDDFIGGQLLLWDDGEVMGPCQARDHLEPKLKEMVDADLR